MLRFQTLGQRIMLASLLGLVVGVGAVMLYAGTELASQDSELAGVSAREAISELATRAETDLERAHGVLRGLAAALAMQGEVPSPEQAAALLETAFAGDPTLCALHFSDLRHTMGPAVTVARMANGLIARTETPHRPQIEGPAPKMRIAPVDTGYPAPSGVLGLDLVLDLPNGLGGRLAATVNVAEWRRVGTEGDLAGIGAQWSLVRDDIQVLSYPEGWAPDLQGRWKGLKNNLDTAGSIARDDEGLRVSVPLTLIDGGGSTQIFALVPAHRLGALESRYTILGAIGTLALCFGLVVTLSLTRPLVVRLRRTAARLADITNGDHDLTIKLDLEGGGEVGQLAGNFDKFVEEIRSLIEGIAETAAALDENTEEIESKTKTLRTHCASSRDAAEKTTASSTDVAMNLASAEAEVGSMSSSIEQISKDIEKSSASARRAAEVAHANAQTIQSLTERSNEIDQFVEVINGISEQTNLLALNATIEAARAGESGKGFAVVANEVKMLAQEAAEATETIRQRIEAIQTEISAAVHGSESIDHAIREVNEIGSQIAEAMMRQSAVTSTINGVLREASGSVSSITSAAEIAEHSAAQNEMEAKQTSATAMEVATVSANLRIMIDEFRY